MLIYLILYIYFIWYLNFKIDIDIDFVIHPVIKPYHKIKLNLIYYKIIQWIKIKIYMYLPIYIAINIDSTNMNEYWKKWRIQNINELEFHTQIGKNEKQKKKNIIK